MKPKTNEIEVIFEVVEPNNDQKKQSNTITRNPC